MFSVDPGKDCTYGEWFHTNLVACGDWWPRHIEYFNPGDDLLIIEDQQVITQGDKKRRTPNPASIVKLAQYAGAVASRFGWPAHDNVVWVDRHAWKGNTPKPNAAADWASYQIHRRVVAALDTDELRVYESALMQMPPGKRHNLADGVGIGLHHLGRLLPLQGVGDVNRTRGRI